MDRDPYPGMASSAAYDTGRSLLNQLNPAMITPWNLPIMAQSIREQARPIRRAGITDLLDLQRHCIIRQMQHIELLEFIRFGPQEPHGALCS